MATFRVRPEGGTPELIAWGPSLSYGLAFSPKGELCVTDNSYDDRGSRAAISDADLEDAIAYLRLPRDADPTDATRVAR